MVRRFVLAFPRRLWWSLMIAKKLPELIPRYTKDGLGSTPNYSARACFRRSPFSHNGYRGRYDKPIYWDAPFGIVLFHNDSAIGCIGFYIRGRRIEVHQIQGVVGSSDLLQHLRWERLLLRLVIECARSLGYRTIEVQPGHKNRWGGDSHRKDKFKLRYDVTAKREGLRMNSEKVLALTL